MGLEKATALTIILGSGLFLISAFLPIARIYGTSDPAQQLEIIRAAPTQWAAQQVLFALGSIVTVVGIAMLAAGWSGQGVTVYLNASVALMGIGALLWTWHVYMRVVDPMLFTTGEISPWLFVSYSLLTMIGLGLVGVALLQMPIPTWVGWLSIGAAGLFFALAVLFRDMPPFAYYVVTLAIGIMIYRAASAQASLAPGID